jgi:hypothetical protein
MTPRLVLMMALLAAAAARGQSPAADWRTVTTPHFRVHYTPRDESWALRAASRLESVRNAVAREVGYATDEITDVLVENPIADANGLTLPLLGAPRIVYYTEPPEPESTIGEYRDWIDLLTVHETAHLLHLMRPSRNPLTRTMERLLPLDPITLGAPRWVLEGYATVVEGRVTGSGRPNGAMRAAILRRWAASGRLPSYGELNSSQRFLGMSMAYLAGSAYLEWLERRSGPDALRHLWARMTARQRRSFDEAFLGVFGESPSRLYAQFTAELTRNSAPMTEAGELWQETAFDSGDPAVSPDGKKLAMVLRNAKNQAKLVVFSAGPNEAEEKLDKRIAAMLKRDPEDVAPLRAKPLPRKPLHELRPSDGGDIETPRWTRDGTSLIYTHRQPDRDGFLHRDLFRWTPATGRVERITHLADVHDADPLPGGTHAVAVRNRGGASQLVTVNLLTGEVAERTPPSLAHVYAHPRASADGRVAWAEHAGSWRVMVDGQPAGPDGTFWPEWGSGGALFATYAHGGDLDLVRLDSGNTAVMAHSNGALGQPAPAPDGSLYFLSLDPDGQVVRHLTTLMAQDVAPPPPALHEPFAEGPVSAARPYGLGRQEPALVLGGTYAHDLRFSEVGVRFGDVVGRFDTLVLGAIGDMRGAALAVRWRGWPVNAALHLFHTNDARGAEVRGSYTAHLPPQRTFVVDAGALAGGGSRLFVDTAFRATQRTIASEEVRLAADSRHHARASVRLGVRAGGVRAALTLAGARRDVAVGGLPSSLEPESRNIPRVFDPALAGLTTSGYRGARAEVTSGSLTFFVQHHRLDGGTIRLAGVAVVLRSDVQPLVRLPALDLTAGVARVLEEHRTRAWVGVRWRP